MIHSMTAFSRQQTQFEWGVASWEIRAVNHRYLEPSFKLPESNRGLESPLRDLLRSRLARGKVECSLKLQSDAATVDTLTLDEDRLQAIITAAEFVQHKLYQSASINPLELLQWPGVISGAPIDNEQLEADILSTFNTALDQLLSTRMREGGELKGFIEQRLTSVVDIVGDVRSRLPEILAGQRKKLGDRLAELKAELDNDRLEQEMALLAQKADVDEELDRLSTHVQEVQRVLKQGGHCGRRLDFLMQELNREANTLSSKSIVSETTQAAVELKVLIEQMREQIQNIE